MKLLNTLIILCMLVLSISCKKSESTKTNEANLLKVTFTSGTGTIDPLTNKVIIKTPESTDISKMIPQFEISKNATIYPPSGVAIDFTNPVLFTITSEDKTKNYVFTVIIVKPIVKFTVYDCSNWSPASFKVLQANAVIKVYTSASDVGTTKTYDVLTSDQNGLAILYGVRSTNYYYNVVKDNKSDIINGYVLQGTYNTQADVNGAIDTAAKIGGLWFMDFNSDARLDMNDKSNFEYISSVYDLIDHPILLKDLYIANKI